MHVFITRCVKIYIECMIDLFGILNIASYVHSLHVVANIHKLRSFETAEETTHMDSQQDM